MMAKIQEISEIAGFVLQLARLRGADSPLPPRLPGKASIPLAPGRLVRYGVTPHGICRSAFTHEKEPSHAHHTRPSLRFR
jgi:hypothetical protein